jgi:spore germination protein YaaH
MTGWKSLTQAWLYPGVVGARAADEYRDGRAIHALKPCYFRVEPDGSLVRFNQTSPGDNGFSAENVADIKRHSTEQFALVGSHLDAMQALLSSPKRMDDAIATLTEFSVATGFTGIELDWEGYDGWTDALYAGYLAFVGRFATTLHDAGKQLIVIGPPISNAGEQARYRWRYEDLAASAADRLLVMAYDYQFSAGAGTPVAPMAWIEGICDWMIAAVGDPDRIIVGLNSYGYVGLPGTMDPELLTHEQLATKPGFATAVRDIESQELFWTCDGAVACYSDTATLDAKRRTVESKGIRRLSVWHLGGNDWFSRG